MTTPTKIDKDVRRAVLNLIRDVIAVHPEANEDTPTPHCYKCRHVTEALALLDAEQREHGPPIDVTDPSYLRMTAKAST
jgi:hypothetical protein